MNGRRGVRESGQRPSSVFSLSPTNRSLQKASRSPRVYLLRYGQALGVTLWLAFWVTSVLLADAPHANGRESLAVTTPTNNRTQATSPAPSPSRTTMNPLKWLLDHFEPAALIAGLIIGLATLLATIAGVRHTRGARIEAREHGEQRGEKSRSRPSSTAHTGNQHED